MWTLGYCLVILAFNISDDLIGRPSLLRLYRNAPGIDIRRQFWLIGKCYCCRIHEGLPS